LNRFKSVIIESIEIIKPEKLSDDGFGSLTRAKLYLTKEEYMKVSDVLSKLDQKYGTKDEYRSII